MKTKQVIGICLSAIILIGMLFVPATATLSVEGIRSSGVLLAVVVMLITEPLPFGVICILGPALLVIFGAVPNISTALSGYTNHILFFVLISFGISAAFTKVNLSKRLIILLIKIFGVKIKYILLAFMLCAALLSSIMSNVASAAILMVVVNDMLKIYDENDRKKSGKSFMIGLPMACIFGGMMTPAGNSLNLLILDYLETYASTSVTFVQWMIVGIPLALFALFISWILLLKIFPPAELGERKVKEYTAALVTDKKLTSVEKRVLVIVCILFVFWVLSSWLPQFNITVVGIIGFTCLFIPKFKILTWEEFTKSVSWPAFFLIGSMMSFGNALTANGVGQWLMQSVFPNHMALPLGLIVFIMAISVSVMLVAVPITPALITMLAVPFISLAQIWGIPPVVFIFVLIFCSVNSLHLPLDTVPLMTYMSGYYSMGEMTKIGVPVEICFNVALALWLPFILKLLNLT